LLTAEKFKRLAEIKTSRGCDLGELKQSPDKVEYLIFFDGMACLGNEFIANTYRPFFNKKILFWDNNGFDQYSSIPLEKDFNIARNNYLYLSGSGFVLAGLDFVLEAFTHLPNLNLFVCGDFDSDRDFVKCFEKELFRTANIFPMGWSQYGSYQYNWLMRRCSSTIFRQVPLACQVL